jgi:hypothetical protein
LCTLFTPSDDVDSGPCGDLAGLVIAWFTWNFTQVHQSLLSRRSLGISRPFAEVRRARELLSRPVDQDRLGGFGLGLLAGSFDELAVGEGRSGADQGDEVGCDDGAPAVLG